MILKLLFLVLAIIGELWGLILVWMDQWDKAILMFVVVIPLWLFYLVEAKTNSMPCDPAGPIWEDVWVDGKPYGRRKYGKDGEVTLIKYKEK